MPGDYIYTHNEWYNKTKDEQDKLMREFYHHLEPGQIISLDEADDFIDNFVEPLTEKDVLKQSNEWSRERRQKEEEQEQREKEQQQREKEQTIKIKGALDKLSAHAGTGFNFNKLAQNVLNKSRQEKRNTGAGKNSRKGFGWFRGGKKTRRRRRQNKKGKTRRGKKGKKSRKTNSKRK